MHYLVMDEGRTTRTEVEAESPRQAREKAKSQLGKRGWRGQLQVFVREDPLKGNLESSREFFGARPPVIL